ncbi:uncharacterized protein [Battus philenor]|uniref:uncharacterized protein n=1 Tax=Battus philenor TaxID=42288 RepID=UPI0035CF66BC
MNHFCFICNTRAGISLRNGVNIFGEHTTLQSGKQLVDALSEIVDKPINESDIHSKILCKKCHKTCTEYDSIQVRLKVIKTTMLEQFKKTLPRHNLGYDTYGKVKVETSVANVEKKFEGKKVVLPASKLQPLPPDYVLKAGRWQTGQFKTDIVSKLKNQEIRILSPSTLNLKVTVGSSVLTQSVKTTSALAGRQKTTMESTTRPTAPIVTSSTSIPATSTSSVLSFNLKDLPKDFLSSAVLTKIGESVSKNAVQKKEIGNVVSEPEIEKNSMEIDEDCSLAVITASEDDKLVFGDSSDKNQTEASKTSSYFDVNLLSNLEGVSVEEQSEDQNKYILSKYEILNDQEDDNEEEHTIVMDGENGSIIRVVSGKKFLYGDSEISLVMPGTEGFDGNENGDSQDSNEESQIELQVSGDEETANAIIAAAQEQGGAFIKVESGEMFQVKSVQSKSGEEIAQDDSSAIISYEDGQFKCLICEKNDNKDDSQFTEAAAAAQHARLVHDARVHVCGLCGAVMRKKADYLAHLDKHSGKPQVDRNKVHECTICKKKYNSRQILTEHMNVHSGERPHRCSVCDKTFASKYTYQSHLKTHLDRPRPFKCSQCGKSFLTQQNLTQHLKTHSGVKDFICKVCGKAFGTQHNLEVHGVVHSGNRPFVCGVCGKAFARRAEVRDHMRIHTGERPFSCEICGASFTQRSNLHSHRRATHLDDKRYKCQLCPKRFKRRRLLDYHVKASHTGERPLQCEICRATFVYPEHYKKHVRIHSGEKPYVCEVCGRAFNTRDNLNTHLYVHSDKKPYECVVCGAGYMRKQLLYHHMNTTGHLSESIVVNQPRIMKVPNVVTSSASIILDPVNANSTNLSDAIFEATETVPIESAEKSIGKSTINLVQSGKETPLITLHNIENVKDEQIMEAVATEQLVDDAQQLTTEETDASGMLRLVQIQLPDGRSGWLAVNS